MWQTSLRYRRVLKPLRMTRFYPNLLPRHYMSKSSDTSTENEMNKLEKPLDKVRTLFQSKISLNTAPSWTKDMRTLVAEAGTRLNQITGYDEVATLKRNVIQAEEAFLASREKLRQAKQEYEEAVSARASSQREINRLLQHQQSWNEEDVIRFAEQFRKEQLDEQVEKAAKIAYTKAEEQVEQCYNQLVDAIRARYHEEQLWSDKIRGASTYGTLALMFINVVLFIAVQTIFEPRKREKLTQRIERMLDERVTAIPTTTDTSSDRLQEVISREQQHFHQLEASLQSLAQQVSDLSTETRKLSERPSWDQVIWQETGAYAPYPPPIHHDTWSTRLKHHLTNTLNQLIYPDPIISAAEGMLFGILVTWAIHAFRS
jgi:hypothetical protein